MSIAQQIATPTRPSRPRRPGAPLQPVPVPRRGLALVRIAGLLSATALCTALLAGAIAIGMLMLATSLGG